MTQKSTSQKPTPKKHPLLREGDIEKHKEGANELNQEAEEHGGQEGPDPTRYGDWEKDGRCTDF